MKRFLSFICALVLLISQSMTVWAVTDIPDAFGNDFVEFDVNADGSFNVCDLVRIKKYIAGVPTVVNLKHINNYTSDAEILIVMRQELLKGWN